MNVRCLRVSAVLLLLWPVPALAAQVPAKPVAPAAAPTVRAVPMQMTVANVITATLKATARKEGALTVGKAAWSCTGTRCTSTSPDIFTAAACGGLAAQVGGVAAFADGAGRSLSAGDLSTCNAAAGGVAPATATSKGAPPPAVSEAFVPYTPPSRKASSGVTMARRVPGVSAVPGASKAIAQMDKRVPGVILGWTEWTWDRGHIWISGSNFDKLPDVQLRLRFVVPDTDRLITEFTTPCDGSHARPGVPPRSLDTLSVGPILIRPAGRNHQVMLFTWGSASGGGYYNSQCMGNRPGVPWEELVRSPSGMNGLREPWTIVMDLVGADGETVFADQWTGGAPRPSALRDLDGDSHWDSRVGGDDCDDNDILRYPGHEEVMDPGHRDEDCDPTTIAQVDNDGDGYISAQEAEVAVPGGPVVKRGEDCDDNDVRKSPRSSWFYDPATNGCRYDPPR